MPANRLRYQLVCADCHSPVEAGPPLALYSLLSNTAPETTSCMASHGEGVGVMARKRWLARKPGTVRTSLATWPMYQTCQSASRAGLRKSISTM